MYNLLVLLISVQTAAQPRALMTQVLGALQELKVRWKKIGHYNMKCLWNHAFWDNESLATNHINDHVYHANEANANTLQPQAILKFEMQALDLSLLISFCYLFTCLKSSPYALQVTKMEVLCP